MVIAKEKMQRLLGRVGRQKKNATGKKTDGRCKKEFLLSARGKGGTITREPTFMRGRKKERGLVTSMVRGGAGGGGGQRHVCLRGR